MPTLPKPRSLAGARIHRAIVERWPGWRIGSWRTWFEPPYGWLWVHDSELLSATSAGERGDAP